MKIKLRNWLVLTTLITLWALPAKAAIDDYFDSYGRIEWIDEEIRLMNFEKYLIDNPNMTGYIGFHWSRGGGCREMKRRVTRARDFLLDRKRISSNRLVIIAGRESDDPLTILQPVGKDLPPPKF